nr:hypothetical protein K-LCC10_0085 [Kaumoebavirus]
MWKAVIIALILVTLLLVFQQEVCEILESTRSSIKGLFAKEELCNSCYKPSLATNLSKKEGFLDPQIYKDNGMPWVEHLTNTEISPAMKENHDEFTQNLARFYLGPDFTGIAEDNRDVYSTNFVGLRRPQAVPVSGTTQQVQDVDYNELKKNGTGWGNYFNGNSWMTKL